MLANEFVLYLLEAGLVFGRFLLVLLLHLCHLTLILGQEGLLRGVSLIAKLLNDCLDFSISLPYHFFSDRSLCLNVLILGFFEKLTLQFVLFDHQTLLHLLDLVLVPPLCILYPIFSLFALFSHCVRCPSLDLLYLFFEAIVLHLEHLFDTCVFIKNCILPALALLSELRLKALVLLV